MGEAKDTHISLGKATMLVEAQAITDASHKLGAEFTQAVEAITEMSNSGKKLIFCGIGKSGHIARKLSTTFMSAGISCIFLHASEAIHGDLGIYKPGDVTILLSKSGSSEEIVRILPIIKGFKSTVIAILGRLESPIGAAADIVLDASVDKEGDTLNLLPTASASVALALGDALASAVIHAKGFTSEEFARYHPGGQLGRNLLLTVGDVMHKLDKIACLTAKHTLKDAVLGMTEFPLGAACIVDDNNTLIGILTDGDIRRLLSKKEVVLDLPLSECMTQNPLSVNSEILLREALRIMEDRPSQISAIPVVEKSSHKLLGLIRVHDIHQTNFS
ncbi:MAG: KpsF/GutQ family sugar-phosphate isomerase [Verrucomicrobia bacterium]|nr:KpsF/GutQ family sugar-phosphate isomerase [Verrucomicrobiota bacterium]